MLLVSVARVLSDFPAIRPWQQVHLSLEMMLVAFDVHEIPWGRLRRSQSMAEPHGTAACRFLGCILFRRAFWREFLLQIRFRRAPVWVPLPAPWRSARHSEPGGLIPVVMSAGVGALIANPLASLRTVVDYRV